MEPILYDHFERIEETHWWWRGRRTIILAMLRLHLPPPGPWRILDVGCGMGALLAALPPDVEGYGVDPSAKAVESCRGQGLTRVQEASAESLPFEPGFFDAVLALDVLEHLDLEAPALTGMRRVLKPGGLLVATVPAFQALWSRWDDINHHRRRYLKSDLLAVLRAAGFDPVLASYLNFFLSPAMAARAAVERLRPGHDLPFGAHLPPSGLNRALEAVFSFERHWLLRGRGLPWGSSVLALATRGR